MKVFLSAEHIRQVGLPSACARAQVALRHARYAICTFTLTAFKDAAVARVLLFYLQALLFPLRLCTVGTCTVVHWLRKKNGGGGRNGKTIVDKDDPPAIDRPLPYAKLFGWSFVDHGKREASALGGGGSLLRGGSLLLAE